MATPRTPKRGDAPTDVSADAARDAVEEAVILTDPPVDTSPQAPDEAPPSTPDDPAAPVLIDLDTPAVDPAPHGPSFRSDPPPPPAPAPRRGGFVPMLLGGVLAAGAGFGLSQVVPDGWPMAQDAELAPAVAAQADQIARLTEALAALPPPAVTDLAPLEARIDDLSARLDTTAAALAAAEAALAALPAEAPALPADLLARIDALDARLATVEAIPPGTVVQGGGDPAALAAVRAEIETLKTALSGPSAPAEAAVAEVTAAAEAARAALAGVTAEAEALTAQAVALKAEAEAAAQSGRLQAALGRIRAALESGAPFATALSDLQAGGIEVPPVLADAGAGGLPTLAALQASFPAAARRALEDSLRADMGDSTAERLGSFLRTQVGARSLTPREGTDPDAVLSRAEAALSEGRLPDALAEIAGLPEPGQAALAPWVADARRRIDAGAAVEALSAALDGG